MSQPFFVQAHFGPSQSGLSTVGYTLVGGTRTTAGVAEVAAGTGSYGATVALPDAGYSGPITWDNGGSPAVTITGSINVPSDTAGVNVTSINGSAAAAASLQAEMSAKLLGAVSSDSAPSTTVFTSNTTATPGLSTVNGFYTTPHSLVCFYSGAAAVKTAPITGYTVSGGVGTFTVFPALPVAPAAGDKFFIISMGQ